ncbi:MAG: hypothetical protein GQE15_41495 [Archangiaceae bacterium]|nr:hypothetical protein [Archangiaceae bacterium]
MNATISFDPDCCCSQTPLALLTHTRTLAEYFTAPKPFLAKPAERSPVSVVEAVPRNCVHPRLRSSITQALALIRAPPPTAQTTTRRPFPGAASYPL